MGAPAEEAPKSQIEEEDERLFDFDLEGIDLRDYDEIAEDAPSEEETEEEEAVPERRERKPKKWLGPLILVLILAILGSGAFWFYRNIYLQTVDQMTVEGDMHQLTVTLDTDIPDNKLSVSCTDTYGNTVSSDVVEGKAVFTDLKAGTQYRLDVQVEGFHSLCTAAYHFRADGGKSPSGYAR